MSWTTLDMPRKNKATLARLANFPKAPPKSYRTTVEDASDSESDSEDSEYRPNTRSTTLTTPDNDDDRGEALKEGIHHRARSHLWLLPQVPLWIKFYWTILGGSEIPVSFKPQNRWPRSNGTECSRVSWWHSAFANQTVSSILALLLNF